MVFMSEVLLVSISWHGVARIWSMTDYKCLATWKAAETHITHALSVSTDAKSIVISQMQIIAIWDSDTALSTPNADSNSGVELNFLRFSADSAYLARASSKSNIKLWNPRTGSLIGSLPDSQDCWRFDWGPDSRALMSWSGDGNIRLWDVSTGACTHILTGYESEAVIGSVNLSANREMIARTSHDGIARVYGVITGTCTHIFAKDHFYKDAVFSPDTKLLAATSASEMHIWNLGTHQCICELELDTSTDGWAFSPDSRLLAHGYREWYIKGEVYSKIGLRVWELATGACLCTLDFGRKISNLAFDETGTWLCTNIGRVALASVLSSSCSISISDWPRPDICTGVWLSPNNAWITWNSHKLLWVPPQYRTSARRRETDVKGSRVAIGLNTDRVMFISVDEPALSRWMPS